MELSVELIYDADCPNVNRAREVLRKGLTLAGLPLSWTEWERSAPGSPSYVRGYGSPTILVNGRDVAGAGPGNGDACCRLYSNESGELEPVPPVARVSEVLQAAGLPPS